MHLTGRPVAAFDPEGLIFGAGVNSECVKLYDLRSFDKVRRSKCSCAGNVNSSDILDIDYVLIVMTKVNDKIGGGIYIIISRQSR